MQAVTLSHLQEPLIIESPLTQEELVWRDRYKMLESHGYRLRQRYRYDWVPSWLSTKRHPLLHDDFEPHHSSETIDAIRVSDGRIVFLKRIRRSSDEFEIHSFLSDPIRIQDPQNHSPPLLDVLPDDDYPEFIYMVMPLLRPFDLPEFFSVEEVVDFVKQLLEGITYMHNLRIAHRDCSLYNIMMDANPMYPRGFHPKNVTTDTTGYKAAHPRRRRDVLVSVRYYLIDFGISSMFGPKESTAVLGVEGQDEGVPELSTVFPYSPFHVDLYTLGNVLKKAFLDKFDNVAFLNRLVEEMIQGDPFARGSAARLLKVFNAILVHQSPRSLRWRLRAKECGKRERFLLDVDSLFHEGTYLVKHATLSTSGAMAQLLARYPRRGTKR